MDPHKMRALKSVALGASYNRSVNVIVSGIVWIGTERDLVLVAVEQMSDPGFPRPQPLGTL